MPKKILKNKREVFLLFFVFLILAVVFPSLLIRVLTNVVVPEHVMDIRDGLYEEKLYLLEKAKHIAGNNSLQRAIRDDNNVLTFSIIIAEQDAANVDNIIITNSAGKILAQSPTSISTEYYNDSFGTIPVLRDVIDSQQKTSFEQIYLLPLNLVVGANIRQEDTNAPIGKILLGYNLDDKYAHYFQEKYLAPAIEVVFYNKNDKIEGTSFGANTNYDTLLTYVRSKQPFDLLLTDGPDDDHHSNVKYGEKIYHIHNFKLKDSGGLVVGSLLAFIPVQTFSVSVTASAVFSLLFFVSVSLLHLRKNYVATTDFPWGMFEVTLTLILFFLVGFMVSILFQQSLVVF